MSGGHLSSPPLAQSDIQQRLLTLQVAAGSYQESLISLFESLGNQFKASWLDMTIDHSVD